MSFPRSQTDSRVTTGDWAGLLASPQTSSRGPVQPFSLPVLTDVSLQDTDWGEGSGEEGFLPIEEYTGEVARIQTSGDAQNQLLPLKKGKKRGRKPNRPFDPVHKKTEEKDKYWLRAFRAYMLTRFAQIRKTMTAEERFFWRDYLGPEGKPEKGNRFSSFGKQYKNALFANPSFVQHFKEWFLAYGEIELLKKYSKQSPLWFVFYDYAAKDLLGYDPNSQKPAQPASSLSPIPPATPEQIEETLLMLSNEEGSDVDMLLEDI